MWLCFTLAAFKILHLTFVTLILLYIGICLLSFIFLGDSLTSWTWTSISYFDVREVFNHNFIRNPFCPFLYFPSAASIMWMLLYLTLSQKSLKVFSFFFNPFRYSDRAISTILSSRLLVSSSVSPNLPLIPSHLFFISVIVLLSFVFYLSFLLLCWISQCVGRIFMTISLNPYQANYLAPLGSLFCFVFLWGFNLVFCLFWDLFLCIHLLFDFLYIHEIRWNIYLSWSWRQVPIWKHAQWFW